jgi:nitroimidazol reductase NimA-like FMN-containing flavoprotein (pyridoxamine 5'-phosphate oxidase superfamily)
MDSIEVDQVLRDDVVREILETTTLARLAYTAKDGSPRVVPIGFAVRGDRIVLSSASFAQKVGALRRDPRVALTIDIEAQPPAALLLRGTAEIEIVPGVTEEYLEASRPHVSPGHWDEFEADVRGLYDEMARISISIDWAKVIDFRTRMPESIERLVAQRGDVASGSRSDRASPVWAQRGDEGLRRS